MNLQPHQIDPFGRIDNPRVVGFAVGDELQKKLDKGFLCGEWSPQNQGYAVLRPTQQRGCKSPITPKLQAEAMRLRDRLVEIAAEAGVPYSGLVKRLEKVARERRKRR